MPPILAIPSIGGKEKIALIIAGCILFFCAVLGIGAHVYHNLHQEVLQLPKELPETQLPKEQPEPENHNFTLLEGNGSSDKKHRMIGDTCNLSMGASLLIMLFARHGPHIGLNDFPDLYGRSELKTGCGPIFDVKADFWKRNPHATEFQKAKFLMKETQNLIRFNRASLIHGKMETILAAMNRMRTIDGSSWLVRLLKALYYGWPGWPTVDDDEADADSEE